MLIGGNDLRLQRGNLRIPAGLLRLVRRLQPGDFLLLFVFLLLYGKINGQVTLRNKAFLALLHLLAELRVSNLLEDGGVAGLIHLKNLSAFGTSDFLHIDPPVVLHSPA